MKSKMESDNQRYGKLNTIVGKATVVTGNMVIQNSLRVDGKVKGKIEVTDTVIVGKEGVVEGEIQAKDVLVGGKIVGNISASSKVLLESNAKVFGDIKASQLVVDEGALFDGQCSMKNNDKPKENNK